MSLFITAGIVVFYTFLGGFLAVSWTDCIQGALMFFAILAVPITAAMYLGGPIETMQLIQSEFPQGLTYLVIRAICLHSLSVLFRL